MSTGPSRILDDFARLLADAAGAAQGVRREVESGLRAQMERLLNSMDIVQRDEFEAVKEMALKARAENDALSARIAELEAANGATPAEKPAARRRAPKNNRGQAGYSQKAGKRFGASRLWLGACRLPPRPFALPNARSRNWGWRADSSSID
ncbi:MAG: accessory factor UbiK family protein [Phyllobacteriaceae bacterium]|nr:accessory factor UbiK family protein [Phyllobacteriaceae bacterium]